MSDSLEIYTLPRITMTPEPDGSVRATMDGGEFTFMSRPAIRMVLCALGLGVPEWLWPDKDLKGT